VPSIIVMNLKVLLGQPASTAVPVVGTWPKERCSWAPGSFLAWEHAESLERADLADFAASWHPRRSVVALHAQSWQVIWWVSWCFEHHCMQDMACWVSTACLC
jgi:hypothetical protein